ncbi:hypothetical protein EH223_17185 [candidate division KSB1 bacterium]|nr:hypothetical protein [candidate division KSB1 bacterium]RQW00884.1 MAG: hypothetical protein EH223_17185 [candidate division KSB1 bacterium]
MLCLFRGFALALVLFLIPLQAMDENGLLLHARVGFNGTVSPPFITTYWPNSVSFSGGFGATLSQEAQVFFCYTNHSFNSVAGIIAHDYNAYAHEILLSFMHYFKRRSSCFPFYQVGIGYTVLRSPAIYKESIYPGFIDLEQLLEPAHAQDGPTVCLGAGLGHILSDSQSMLFFELLLSSCFVHPKQFTYLGGRCGVIFKVGDF